MPSPFPGMDPFLEEPSRWRGVHGRLTTALADELNTVLPPEYYAELEERVYVTKVDENAELPQRIPDLVIATASEPRRRPTRVGVATVEPVHIEAVFDEEIHDRYVEIRTVESERVVATLEVLSPTNKRPGSRGREELLKKRSLILAGGANWIEIDLLRAGERSPEYELPSDYCVTLKRPGRPGLDVWFIDLRDPLPAIAVPLGGDGLTAPLDLQGTFTAMYDRAGYAHRVNYDGPVPRPALGRADERWVRERIAEWRRANERTEET